MTLDWTPFVDLVRSHQRFLLLTHIRPDGDALGSQLAMADALEQCGKTGLLIEANSQIKYSRLVEVLDACRCAGFENISFAPPTDG